MVVGGQLSRLSMAILLMDLGQLTGDTDTAFGCNPRKILETINQPVWRLEIDTRDCKSDSLTEFSTPA
jgi:hypothetical protein